MIDIPGSGDIVMTQEGITPHRAQLSRMFLPWLFHFSLGHTQILPLVSPQWLRLSSDTLAPAAVHTLRGLTSLDGLVGIFPNRASLPLLHHFLQLS